MGLAGHVEGEGGGGVQLGGGLVAESEGLQDTVVEVHGGDEFGHGCAPFCVVIGAPVSAGGAGNRLRVGGQSPKSRVGRSRAFGPG